MRILVVDDLRTFPRLGAEYARTSAEALVVLDQLVGSEAVLDELWLDHDLGTGADGALDDIGPVVDWLCERAFFGEAPRIGVVVVHTSNPVGARMIDAALQRWYPVRRVDALDAGATVAPRDERGE
ncbi:MAG: cyclic-phosphate processing receiver domain-containing protein [Nocardioidaceae bacterium]